MKITSNKQKKTFTKAKFNELENNTNLYSVNYSKTQNYKTLAPQAKAKGNDISIDISTSYGFCNNWTLNVYGKSFYLGQDVKFCIRVLGCEPSYIVSQIGSSDLSKENTKKKLAKFILKTLNLTRLNIKDIEPWGLCSE